MNSPPLTVIMPTFNAMPFLREAVSSICRQTFGDWELIISDDGSTDESNSYLASLSDPRIRTVSQEGNRGPSLAFNRALETCESEFVARMDADDVSLENRFQEQVGFLRSRQEVGLVGSQYRPFGSKRVGGRSQLPLVHDRIFDALLTGRHAICNPTVMCRTALLRQIGGYRADGVLEDWAMFLNMGQVAQLANIDEPLLLYRIHMGSTNTQHMKELRSRIAFACDRVRRSQADAPAIDYLEYVEMRRSAPLRVRFAEWCNVQAMVMYRGAQSEIFEGSPFCGLLRLAVAASLSPGQTLERVTRRLRKQAAPKHNP